MLITTVILTSEDSQTTRVTVTMQPLGATSTEAINVFRETRPGMTQGWTGSFDKLETMVSPVAHQT